MINITEGSATVQVCATLSATDYTERSFGITLATSDGTGTYIIIQASIIELFVLQALMALITWPFLLTILSYLDLAVVMCNVWTSMCLMTVP